MKKTQPNIENPLQFVRRITALSQTDFATKIGVSRSLLAKLESKQQGYQQPSDRVCRMIAREFGAWLQSPDSAHLALGFDHQPYTRAALEKHQKQGRTPFAEDFSLEIIGMALAWVGKAAAKTGYAASFHENLKGMMLRLNEARGLADELDRQLTQTSLDTSKGEYIAATWLQQFFDLPQATARLPRFLGHSRNGEPIYEVNFPVPNEAETKPISKADQSTAIPLDQSATESS